MKLFRMNEYETVAAETMEDALQCYADWIADGSLEDVQEHLDDPTELTKSEMDTLMFIEGEDAYSDTAVKRSFTAQLQLEIEKGGKFPQVFASCE